MCYDSMFDVSLEIMGERKGKGRGKEWREEESRGEEKGKGRGEGLW